MKSAIRLVAILMAMFSFSAQAQSPIVVGQSFDSSPANAPRFKEYAKGVDAHIKRVNEQGGVNGRLIKLVRYEDAVTPEKALANAKRLVEQDGAMLFLGMGTTVATATILPYAEENGIPVLGSLSGAVSLRKPHPTLFHFRASFGDEINRLASHFSTVTIKRVAVLAADLPIGKEGIVALESAAKVHGLEIVKIARVAADFTNLDESVAAIAGAAPQAVLVLAPAGPGIKFIEALRKSKVSAQLFGLSSMSSDSLYRSLGEQAKGVVITQVVPFPWSSKSSIARDYQKLMSDAKLPLSIDSMEGYVSVKLLVEGLKAAGLKPTRQSLVAGFEAMNRKDVGGLPVSFSAKDRSMTQYVDITMIGTAGKLQH